MLNMALCGGIPRVAPYYLLRCSSPTKSVANWYRCTPSPYQQLSETVTPEAETDCVLQSEKIKQKLPVPFAKARYGEFSQVPPHQENPFSNNAFLTSYLKRVMPKEVCAEVWPDLNHFGRRCVEEIYPIAKECELNQPYMRTFDAWGNRIDELVTSEAWKRQKAISAEEGLIAIGYEKRFGEFDRLYQVAKLFLYAPFSGLYSCPLAMTDGAAKTSQVIDSPALHKAYKHLTSRDPQEFWTSGQWMTERKGGSDVSGGTDTVAVRQPDGMFRLYGCKWFSSAADSDMALTLANIISEDQPVKKEKGITMFYLETRQEGKLNGLEIVRLKNKLGTRQLPTAELLLDGTLAAQVSGEGRGVASISSMLLMTRLHNALSAIAGMRRILMLARDYSRRRTAFGSRIDSHVLHQLTGSRQEVMTRGCEALVFHISMLLGREENGIASEIEKHVLRIMVPIMKLFTAKAAMAVISEGLECFGGQGYLEDTGLPVSLRDAQVLPIWEGTTNILSLDVLRAIYKTEGSALLALYEDVNARLKAVEASNPGSSIRASCQNIKIATDKLKDFLQNHPDLLQNAARDLATSLAHIYIGGLLLEHAGLTQDQTGTEVAVRWCQMPLYHLTPEQYSADNCNIMMDGYKEEEVYGPMF